MAFTEPKTWTLGTPAVNASDLNTHLRDNLRYLKGLDGVPLIENAIELKDKDGTPVGNVRIKVIDEKVQLRNADDDADVKIAFNSLPTGTGSTEVAIGNHTH